MDNQQLIPVYQFCSTHQIEVSFIDSLQQYGLVEITTVSNETFLREEQLDEIEKFVRLHYDLDINFAGIEAIQHLLQRMKDLQQRNAELRNRLGLYEIDPNR